MPEYVRMTWEFETCKSCTREQRLAWVVDNELWDRVVIKYYQSRVLCLECFLRMADDRKVEIQLEDIKFMGLVRKHA